MLTIKGSKHTIVALLLIAAFVVPMTAFAGTNGGEFQAFFETVMGWATGYLGKGIALMAFLIGLGIGAARANPVPAIAGIIFALFVALGPSVIDSIVTAVV